MSKHTPGPWRRGIGGDAHTVFDDEGRIVADKCGYADGNLIAAAPDLLKALQEYVRDFGDNEDTDSQQMTAKARAAIAKATRGQ